MAFGDIRVADRAEWLLDRIVTTGSLVLRKLGETRAGEVAIQRFLSSRHVGVDRLVETVASRTAAQCAGRRVLAVQDTTEFNFSGREKRRRGFGPGGDGKAPGFFMHPVIAVDVESEAMVGLVDLTIWTRAGRKTPRRGNKAFEEKESERWLLGCRAAASVLRQAAQVIVVADRDSDLYPLFAEKPEGTDLIVRACQDRKLDDKTHLFEACSEERFLGTSLVRVAPRGPGDKERIAQVELRAAKVHIVRPVAYANKSFPKTVEMTLVEAREVDAPKGKTPLLWRLLTTLEADTAEQACDIVQFYRLRWRIEQTFRALKSDGLALEDSQVTGVEHMFNLAAAGLIAAVRTIQLVDARDGSSRPATDVLDDVFAPALERISKKLEGATQRQKNPHSPKSIAFIAWIAARLGGWNCYGKPPGPKTIRSGWSELAAMLCGYALATQEKNP
jgi:DDE family transposase